MEHIRKLVNQFKDKGAPRASEELFKHIEDTFLPHLLRVLQKDNTLMKEVDLFPGVRPEWSGSDEEWSLLNMAILYSVLHGDPKEKFGKILDSIKSLIPGGSAQADEITNILEDAQNQSSIQELLELVMNTRLAGVLGDIVQTIKFDDLGIDFENPEQVLNMIRNPQDSPVLQELMDRAKMILEDRIKTGKINQQDMVREIETIRAKFQSAFGRYLNEMIVGDEGGGTTGNTSAQIMSNHPDARRARMLARLQKKQKEKARK